MQNPNSGHKILIAGNLAIFAPQQYPRMSHFEIHLKTFVQTLPRSCSLGVDEISEKAR